MEPVEQVRPRVLCYCADRPIQAIRALYGSSDGDVQRQADRWLSAFAERPEAWRAARTLLAPSVGPLPALICPQRYSRSLEADRCPFLRAHDARDEDPPGLESAGRH